MGIIKERWLKKYQADSHLTVEAKILTLNCVD